MTLAPGALPVPHVRHRCGFRGVLAALVFFTIFCACFAQSVMAQELLFSFSPFASNAAYSERSFSTEELLVVTVTRMAPGERLTLSRCGNARCSVGAPVAEWTFNDFQRRSPMEVNTEGDLYSLLLFDGTRGVVGTDALVEQGATTVRWTSGTVVTVVVRSAQ